MNTPQPERPVTMRDVARKLGVSHMTVSRALRKSPKVRDALRITIEKAAAEMGYQLNPAAVTLAHFRSTSQIKPIQAVLAWLNFWEKPQNLRKTPIFAGQWKGAVAAAESLGYRIEEFTPYENPSPESFKRILVARGIQGILLPPQRPPMPREKYDFDWSKFAAIRLGHSIPYPLVHMVSHSQASDALEALRNIWEKGYRRIGYVTTRTFRAYSLSDAGYTKARAGWPKKDQLPVLVLDDYSQATPKVLKELDTWMKKYRPDAILSTEWVKQFLTGAGYRVPEDVAVAATSVANSDVDSGMFENPEEVGRIAVINLVGLIQRGELGIPRFRQDILVRSTWQDGASLPNRC